MADRRYVVKRLLGGRLNPLSWADPLICISHAVISHTSAMTTIGRRDFAVSGPTTWNSLPVELRTSSLSPQTFAKKLKTHLFGC